MGHWTSKEKGQKEFAGFHYLLDGLCSRIQRFHNLQDFIISPHNWHDTGGPYIVVLGLHLGINLCNKNLLLWEKSVLMVTQSGKISNSRLATPPDDESEMISDIRFDESQRILEEY